jgi:protein TonB
MTSPIGFLILAAAQGVTVQPSVSPVTVLPPQSLPPGAMQPSQAVRGPQETLPLPRYFSTDDYPTAALASRAEGVVGFALTIGADGRIIGCAITRSSGSAALDAATCNILRRRARFAPAMDGNGRPVVSTLDQQVEWKLPTR